MCNPTQLHTINVHQRRWTDICDICQYTVSLHSSRKYSIGIHSYKIFSFAIHCNLIDLASLQGFVWRLTEINQSINQSLGSYIAYQCYCYFKRQVPLVNFKEKFKDLIQKVFCTFYPIIIFLTINFMLECDSLSKVPITYTICVFLFAVIYFVLILLQIKKMTEIMFAMLKILKND